jgi:hypothetical protein
MIPTLDAAEAATRIARALEAGGVSYAIGGAVALGAHGVPRGTLDVDVNVFVTDEELPRVVAILRSIGIEVTEDAAIARAQRDGMFVGDWGGMRIDVFTPSIPFSLEAEKTRVRVEAPDGGSEWFLSAEALAIFKLLFARPKDYVDLERLIAVQGPQLDHAYVRRWIAEMMGEDDERTRRWDELVKELAGPE